MSFFQEGYTKKLKSEADYFAVTDELIERGIGKCRSDDYDRAMVFKFNPQFFDILTSIDFLKKVAHHRYGNKPNGSDIIKTIEQSFSIDLFKDDLNAVVKEFQSAIQRDDDSSFIRAESSLREVLVVFSNAEDLKCYERPQHIMERAAL